MLERLLGLGDRLGPGAVQLQDLGAMHQALPAIGHELRLRLAPAAQGRRPLLGPPHVEHVLAHLDHRAVHDPGNDRRHLTRRHRHHHLVQLSDTARLVPTKHERLSPAETPERRQIRVAAADTDRQRVSELGEGTASVPGDQMPERHRNDQQAALHAIAIGLVEQVLSARQPTPSRRHLPSQEQAEAEPERAPSRPPRITVAHALVVGSLARGRPDVVLAGKVRRHRQTLQIIDTQRRSAVGGRQLDDGISPRPTLERAPARDPRLAHCPQHLAPRSLAPPSSPQPSGVVTRITLAPARPRLMCRPARPPSNAAAGCGLNDYAAARARVVTIGTRAIGSQRSPVRPTRLIVQGISCTEHPTPSRNAFGRRQGRHASPRYSCLRVEPPRPLPRPDLRFMPLVGVQIGVGGPTPHRTTRAEPSPAPLERWFIAA